MKLLNLIILGILFTTFTTAQTYEDMASELEYWVNKRVENAQNEIKETVVMPYVIRSLGWGCECPYYFIGTNPDMQDGIFIDPIAPRQMPYEPNQFGYRYIVKGYFTGIIKSKTYGEKEYKLPQFRILEFEKNIKGSLADAPKVIKTEKSNTSEDMISEDKKPTHKIVGKWKLTKLRNQELMFNDFYVFQEDGTFIHESAMNTTGKWEIKEKHLFINAGEFEPDFGEIISLDGKTLVMKENDGTESIYIKIEN